MAWADFLVLLISGLKVRLSISKSHGFNIDDVIYKILVGRGTLKWRTSKQQVTKYLRIKGLSRDDDDEYEHTHSHTTLEGDTHKRRTKMHNKHMKDT